MKQFHTPENLAKAINVEAGKYIKHFIWDDIICKEKTLKNLQM